VLVSLLSSPAFAQPSVVAPPGGRAVPVRSQAVKLERGRLVPTSNWSPIFAASDSTTVAAFDAFGGDSAGVPTGFCTAGCDQYGWCPSQGPGTRWWGGTNYRAPVSTNDMRVAPGFEGHQAVRVQLAWWWEHATPTHCYIAVLTGDNFTTCPSGTPPNSGNLGGIVFDFGEMARGDGYWWADLDMRGTGQSWLLPADGSYTIMLGTAYNAETHEFVVDQQWGTQPMQWGTGDRPGSSGPMQWDDWRNANGTIESNECAYYIDTHHCPLPQGAMLAFWTEPGCYANCDASSGSTVLTANDFQCFLNSFVAGNVYANCDQSTVSPTLTANDFQCFLDRYASGCS